MTRKIKREIAKARQRNASSRAAEHWAMQRMAVDLTEREAENEQLRELLRIALDEHDGYHGQFYADYMPEHWTHSARAILTAKKMAAPSPAQDSALS